jgi:hypothetical protein
MEFVIPRLPFSIVTTKDERSGNPLFDKRSTELTPKAQGNSGVMVSLSTMDTPVRPEYDRWRRVLYWNGVHYGH